MEKRTTLNERLISLIPGLREEDIIVPFQYDLNKTSSHEAVDGLAGVLRDKLVIFADGNPVETVPLAEITEFKYLSGIGCVFMEYMKDGKEYMLCRADMGFSRLYASLAKRLNRYMQTNKFDYGYEEEIELYCPKCGRPYHSGSRICDRCVDKKHYLGRIWDIAKPYGSYIYFSVFMYFVIAATSLITPYINRILVDDYIMAKTIPRWQSFLLIILGIFVLNIILRLMSILRSLTLITASNKIAVRLRQLVFNKIEMMSIARISKRTAGELMNRVTGDTNTLNNFVTHEIGNAFEQIIIFVAVGIFLFIYDWKLAMLVILPVPIVVVINRLFWTFMHRHWHKQWTYNAKASTILHDIFSGIRVVKAFGMEKYEFGRYEEVIRSERDISIFNERFFAVTMPIIQFIMGIGEFFLLYYAGSKILKSEMSLGYMQQITSYISLIYGPLFWIARLPRMLVRVMTSIVKIFDVIDEKVDVADRENAKEVDIKGYIEFEDVSFGYDETVDVLKKISLKINPGEMIGIVGKSGVGKSTLINLVMRLYDVDEGAIKIDGINIKDISQDSLRSQIGVVLQETFLFSGTIYDNIAYAKSEATRDEVITSAKIAGAHQFIMKLPDAYNTKVGERGYTLSGGERQRVSIARALLHNPRILILDEATASLDTETEKQIQDSLQKLIKDRTTLAIAHRLSTLRNATRLIVLDKGNLAEVGTHDELMRRKGIYYGLVMAQRQMSKMTAKEQIS